MPEQPISAETGPSRTLAFFLLATSNFFWSGNWVIGRALRDDIGPVSLTFWRWLIAALVLAPFALPGMRARFPAIRSSAGLLVLLAFSGIALFHTLVYLGLHSTTAVNAVLLNSSAPLFMILCSWMIAGERSNSRQFAGMLISLSGIAVILSRGEWASLLALEIHAGDAWVLLAMLAWGVYSVLLKRRPAELNGVRLLFLISAIGAVLLVPGFALESLAAPPRLPTAREAAAVLYISLVSSVIAYICWNRGVEAVGANAAGFTLHLLPVFGTILAMAFLGETFQAFHALGFALILGGVIVATRAARPPA